MLIHGYNCYTTVEHQNILKLEIPTRYFTSFPKVMHFYMRAPTLQKKKKKTRYNYRELCILEYRSEWARGVRL